MTEKFDYYNSEDFKEILRQYEESVKSGAPIYMDADDLTDIADYYNSHDRISEAENAMSLAIEYNPEALGPMLYMARQALKKKDYDTAEQYIEKVQVLDAIEALYLRAEILIEKGNIDEADKLFTQFAEEEVPSDEYDDFIKSVADLYLDYNHFAKASEWIAKDTDVDSEEFKELMARTLFGLGDYKDSEDMFNELLDQNPYSSDYWNGLADVQYMKKDYSSALSSSEYAIAINPNNTNSLLAKAITLHAMGNITEAIKHLKKYVKKEPNNELGFLHLGSCYVKSGALKEGLEAFKKGVSVASVDSPILPDLYQEMAFANSNLGNLEDALWCMDMTDKLDCDHAQMHITKGHILLLNKKKEEAQAIFDKELKESGNDPKLKLRVIISYQDNNYNELAYNGYLDYFKSLGDDNKDGYSYMALCCYDLGKRDEFLYYLKKACDCNPEEARTIFAPLFPEDMEPKDYYEDALNNPD